MIAMLNLPVIICIGTPKVVGDSLGPKVGTILKRRKLKAFVYGDNNRSVTALNFRDYCSFIKKNHRNSLIIAVDAGLSMDDEVGDVKMSTAGVSPGGALDKSLGTIGNIGVLGIVGRSGKENMKTLIDAKVDFIDSLAENVAERVVDVVERARILRYM